MNRKILLGASALILLGCASEPLPRYTPATPRAAAPVPAPAPAPAPVPAPAAAPEPAVESGGLWRVSLISVKSAAKAESLRRQFADKSYRVEIEVVDVAGASWQRVVFPGQETRAQAQELLAKLEKEFGIQNGWIPPLRKAEP